MTSRKVAEKARKVLEKVRKNMPYYTGWIKSLISEMEEYL